MPTKVAVPVEVPVESSMPEDSSYLQDFVDSLSPEEVSELLKLLQVKIATAPLQKGELNVEDFIEETPEQ